MPVVAGVDGCRGGWLMARLDMETRRNSAHFAPRWEDLDFTDIVIAAVDMPIGLTDEGPRACDLAARALLPRSRKPSVFAPPRRYMLACPNWRSAQAEGRRREGVGLSKQSWNLARKIAQIDRHITPKSQARLKEAHPELIFHYLNDWQALPPKKTPDGARRRRAALARYGIVVEPMDSALPRRLAAPDDLLDAAACALAAERIAASLGCCLPQEPPRDRRGLCMEIWY